MKKVFAVLLAAILCLSAFAVLAEEESPEYTMDMFTDYAGPEEGAPVLVLTYDNYPALLTRTDHFEAGEGWYFTVYVQNLTTTDVTLTGVTLVHFKEEGYGVHTYGPEEMDDFFHGAFLEANSCAEFGGGYNRRDFLGVGISVFYTDADGNEYEARSYLPFSLDYTE